MAQISLSFRLVNNMIINAACRIKDSDVVVNAPYFDCQFGVGYTYVSRNCFWIFYVRKNKMVDGCVVLIFVFRVATYIYI